MIADNLIKPPLFAKQLYTFSKMSQVCIKINIITLDKLDGLWSVLYNLWTLSTLGSSMKLDNLFEAWHTLWVSTFLGVFFCPNSARTWLNWSMSPPPWSSLTDRQLLHSSTAAVQQLRGNPAAVLRQLCSSTTSNARHFPGMIHSCLVMAPLVMRARSSVMPGCIVLTT